MVRVKGSNIHPLFDTSLVINDEQCVIEQPRQLRVIRCYNCQGFGHIARHCKNFKRCENCANLHIDEEKCSGELFEPQGNKVYIGTAYGVRSESKYR